MEEFDSDFLVTVLSNREGKGREEALSFPFWVIHVFKSHVVEQCEPFQSSLRGVGDPFPPIKAVRQPGWAPGEARPS